MILLNNINKYQHYIEPYQKLKNNIFNNNNNFEYINNYSNFIKTFKYQHSFDITQNIILYGKDDTLKEYILNNILQKTYGSNNIQLKNVNYTINSYTNKDIVVSIKQSKNHIIIDPHLKNIDKYIIAEIINLYISQYELNVFSNKKNYKTIVIYKIDELNYQTQYYLRSIIEKYIDICKFILIATNLLSIQYNIISRCMTIRIPLFTNSEILETLLFIINKENIDISIFKLSQIINVCDNKISIAILLLEYYTLDNTISFKNIYNISHVYNIDFIVEQILNVKNNNIKNIKHNIFEFRKYLYFYYISNINIDHIIKLIMIKLIKHINDLSVINNIIDITLIYSNRISNGIKILIHFEAYIIKLMYLINNML